MRRTLIGLAIGLAVLLQAVPAAGTNKVTICHNGHTITISVNALDGHFDHDGQPARGHEGDYVGACKVTPPPSTTTTTTVPPTTTTTAPGEPTTTTTAPPPPSIDQPVVIVRSNAAVAVPANPEFTG